MPGTRGYREILRELGSLPPRGRPPELLLVERVKACWLRTTDPQRREFIEWAGAS